MKINVLVIGSGGREHAITWKLKQSKLIGTLYVTPGNSGTEEIAKNVLLPDMDSTSVIAFSKKNNVDLVVVTPDDYLAAGMVDDVTAAGIKCFGPKKDAARIEWSKAYAKELMKRAGIPTARFETFSDYESAKKYIDTQKMPIVIKASGLALGKGVVIAPSRKEATKTLKEIMVDNIFGDSGSTVVIEEFLEGTEISTHAFCDGKTAVMFPSSQDHKQIFDNDKGPNTGGMGTIAPVPWCTDKLLDQIKKTIVDPILAELQKVGTPFTGILYPGLMITKEGPKVIEFNSRFGDPETQSYMRLLETDLCEIFLACCDQSLEKHHISWSSKTACCVVVASKGYPESSEKGMIIKGIENTESIEDIVVFYAGAKRKGTDIVSNGGRVLGVTAIGDNLDEALTKAYSAVDVIKLPGMQFRKDIGHRERPNL